MRTGILLFLTLFPFYLLLADSITISGEVQGEWNVDTVFVNGDAMIRSGEELLINPGVTICFLDHYQIDIQGRLNAFGSEDEKILFTVIDTAGFAFDTIARGGWAGLQFTRVNTGSDSSVFEHCIFKFGKAVHTDTLMMNGGVFNIREFDKIRIDHCDFIMNKARINGGAVYTWKSDIMIQHSNFEHNICGPPNSPWGYGGGISADSSAIRVYNSFFTGNQSTGVGGAISIRWKDAQVNNSIFVSNYSALGGAISFAHYEETEFVQCNNLLMYNNALFFGGAISTLHSNTILANNTIVKNTAVYGGGIYTIDMLVPRYYNSIIRGNIALSGEGNQAYLWDAISSIDFYHCNLEGGYLETGGSGGGEAFSGEYINNIDTDPLFSDPDLDEYILQYGSPSVNTGINEVAGYEMPAIDLNGNPRIEQGLIDMGCYESRFEGLASWKSEPMVEVFPIPVDETCFFSLPDDATGCVTLFIFNVHGNLIKVIHQNADEPLIWNTKSDFAHPVSPGVYYVKIMLEDAYYTTVPVIVQ